MTPDNNLPLKEKIILNANEIIQLKKEGEKLVGGKNYNMAILHQIKEIRVPSFRAVSSIAFHRLLDTQQVNAELIRRVVSREFEKVDWDDPAILEDYDYIRDFVRQTAEIVKVDQSSNEKGIVLRAFIDMTLDSFTTSKEDIDSLRLRSILVQVAILSVELPEEIKIAIRNVYREIATEAGIDNINLAVRSSAAGEDSASKAFAGLQDTYLNIRQEEDVIKAYQWDCASAYNFRSLTYRREAILEGFKAAEKKGNVELAIQAREDWSISNTSLSVCIMRMVDPAIAGTAFSADTATGFRGGTNQDLVTIDASWGIGEAIVGGIVTPDKYWVYQRDDGREVVLRDMGFKTKQYVYDDEKGGTVLVAVPEDKKYSWTLTIAQAEAIAKGVRNISTAYQDIIMDTEFVIDFQARLWFVQARPETKWNEFYRENPGIIPMRRLEVEPDEIKYAKVLLEGNGASRGSGAGTVKFLNSALELNKINKGDILAAERTDPDMVPGMRIASAILASTGGDTSHAAITSRELGIPAVIGIQRTEALRALDGQSVTVDGSRGKVYEGKLALKEFGQDIKIESIPQTKTQIGLILADIGQAMVLSQLRQIPDFQIGLLRAEFMLTNIGIHPAALEAYDNGTLQMLIKKRLEQLNKELDDKMISLLKEDHISISFDLKQYVSIISGIQYDQAKETEDKKQTIDLTDNHFPRIYGLIKDRLDRAETNLITLKITPDLKEHISIIIGLKDELATLESSGDPNSATIIEDLKIEVRQLTENLKDNEIIQSILYKISQAREDIAIKSGLKTEILQLENLETEIGDIIKSRGYQSGKELYIQTLAQGLALFALSFQGKDVIYRTTDYKTNEYRNLIGGSLFEFFEDNPMIGYRGVSRYVHDWEFEAFKLARNVFYAKNMQIMFPFVRTIKQAQQLVEYMKNVHELESGKDGLNVILMSEIPSNAILSKEFIKEVDGFSIGSNDMTQLVLGVDRDNAKLSHVYDEEDPAVVWAILTTIFTGIKFGKKVGFCGQGVANSKIIRGIVSIAGISVASVVPDTYAQTKNDVAALEAEDISIRQLGNWIKKEMTRRLKDRFVIKGKPEKDITKSTTKELCRIHKREKEKLLNMIRSSRQNGSSATSIKIKYHKLVEMDKLFIYANWDWNNTVLDALHEAGFQSFEEFETFIENKGKNSVVSAQKAHVRNRRASKTKVNTDK